MGESFFFGESMRKKSGIYRIVNSENGKMYIGSAVDLSGRKRSHFSTLRKGEHHNMHLQRAFNKYGKDCFKFEVIEKCTTDVLLEREQFNIDSHNFNELYNIAKTAGSTLGTTRTKEQRDAQSRRMTGKYTGEDSSFYGKVHSRESKEQMSKSSMGFDYTKSMSSSALKKLNEYKSKLFSGKGNPMYGKTGSENKLSKRVRMIDKDTGETERVFDSTAEAGKHFGKGHSFIAKCARGGCEVAYGFKWEYV